MPKLRVHNFSISLDGFGAGPDQSREIPLGVGGEDLHQWMFKTRFWHRMVGEDGGEEGLDHEFATQGDAGIGATIMGRNMFGPIRGPWPDEDWRGWWGDNPPYHHPVFVLTHHPRSPLTMQGGTVFNFADEPIEIVLERAFAAANGKDVRLGGGVSVIQQYMRAGLVDEMHVAIAPIFLGGGERLFDEGVAGYRCVEMVTSPGGAAAHVRLARA
jgi:dihydrofolate reductase